jgi:drug/metabolite transporter (DMT)-like permease
MLASRRARSTFKRTVPELMHRASMSRGRALVALHLAVALFGLAALFGKWIALPATAIVLGRTVVAAVTLAIVAQMRGLGIARPQWGMLLNGAILAVHWVAFFAAVQATSVAIGLLGYATFPLFVLALERHPLARRTRGADAVIALIAAIGLVAIVPDLSWSSGSARGLLLGVASGFTFAWLAVRTRVLLGGAKATHIAMWQNAFAAVCLVPVVAFANGAIAWPSRDDVMLLLLLGVACTGLAHTLFIASLQRVSAHIASVVAALEPVYGIALAMWLLHEVPPLRTLVGGTLIVVAAIVASRRTA